MNVVEVNVNEMTMHDAALSYAAQGMAVFPVVANKKNPLSENGFHDATTDQDVINGWFTKTPRANVGVATGKVNGVLVVDVDIKNGKNGEESLNGLVKEYGELPETRKHRTPSGGYHLLFRVDGKAVPSSAGTIGDGLDVRGDGGYVVVPPSNVDGRKYEILNPEVPVAEAPEWLIKLAIEKKTVKEKSVEREEVREGGRNEHIFKFALDCNRRGISKDDALMKALAENRKCIPPLPIDEVCRTIESAYSYEVASVPMEIEELNSNHAVVWIGGKCRVLKEIICPVFGWQDIVLSCPSDFREFYANRTVVINGRDTSLGEAWLKHPSSRHYEGIVFAPTGAPPNYFNLWRGFAVEPKQGDCSLYLQHIFENIANGDQEVYEYILNWMAHTVQHPDNLVGVAIVLRGSMGTGKGVFATEFGKLFGRHYLPVVQGSHLTGKFNAHMKDVVVLFADEAFWAGDKSAEGVLRGLITEPTLTIEGKGDNAFKMKNHLHMIFATNNDWAVPAGPEERRFLVLDVGDKHRQDAIYFKDLADQMNNGGREALLELLMNRDVSNVELRKFPKTKALLDNKIQNLTPAQKFWFDKLQSGELHGRNWGDGTIPTVILYGQYQEFVQLLGVKHRATDNELGMQLGKIFPSGTFRKGRPQTGLTRVYMYEFPTLEVCRKCFEEFLNQKIDWPSEE